MAELYERYQQDPESVDQSHARGAVRKRGYVRGDGRLRSRSAFARWTAPVLGRSPARRWRRSSARSTSRSACGNTGISKAQLDPLGKRTSAIGDPSLDPEAHGVTPDDLRRLPGEPDRRPDRRGRRQRPRSDRRAGQGLLLHDRLRLRAHLRARGARVAALRGEVGAVPSAGRCPWTPRRCWTV